MFLWCHVRHINPLKEYPERILKIDKKIACNLNYDEIEFPVKEKDFKMIEVHNNICINVFGYENELAFPIYISDQKFKSFMDLLLLIMMINHIMCTSKVLIHLCFMKQKKKNGFVKVIYNALVVKIVW